MDIYFGSPQGEGSGIHTDGIRQWYQRNITESGLTGSITTYIILPHFFTVSGDGQINYVDSMSWNTFNSSMEGKFYGPTGNVIGGRFDTNITLNWDKDFDRGLEGMGTYSIVGSFGAKRE